MATSCPICGAPTDTSSAPFCSPRCRAADLGGWLEESYRVDGAPAHAGDDERAVSDVLSDELTPEMEEALRQLLKTQLS